MSSGYHETNLSAEAQNVHRALASLQEELEAVDWYNQRADVADNPQLTEILLHNRNEEIEHAAMLLEWLRRSVPSFDEQLGTYLFTTQNVTQIEDAEGEDDGEAGNTTPAKSSDGSLGIGRL
ncbi:MAG: encapsulin-associated ferritin-like protein [Verrucomicrobiota bacterium]